MIATFLLTSTLLAAVPTAEAHPADSASFKPVQPMSREEFMKLPVEERRAHLAAISYQKNGGIIIKEGSDKGFACVVNAQKRVPAAELTKPVSMASKLSRLRYEIRDGESVTVETASAARAKLGPCVAIFVVDNAAYPALLPAPEEGWAIVNVARLAADKPEPDKLARRLRKECVRAYAFIAGAANVNKQGAAMGPVAGLKDLDALPGDMLSYETVLKFEPQLKLLGVDPYVQASYRAACEKGWAPAPTNDVLKAIWNEVHAAPTKPIIIKPETKKR